MSFGFNSAGKCKDKKHNGTHQNQGKRQRVLIRQNSVATTIHKAVGVGRSALQIRVPWAGDGATFKLITYSASDTATPKRE